MTEVVRTSTFLRWALLADAAISGAMGLLMVLGAALLEQSLQLPAELSRGAGLSLLPFAAFLIYLATRETLTPMAIWTVIGINALWIVGTLLLLIERGIEPNGLGYAFVLFQAAGVALFATAEYVGLRKSIAAEA